jgi:tetratricopeptide (TPR) repeat protein
MELYQRAIQIKPDFTMAYYNLATSKQRAQDIDGAIEAVKGAIGCEPEFAQGHQLLGSLLLQKGDYLQAETPLRTANKLRPNDPSIQRLLQRVADLRMTQGS